jgi:hypothetical protein
VDRAGSISGETAFSKEDEEDILFQLPVSERQYHNNGDPKGLLCFQRGIRKPKVCDAFSQQL